MIPAGASAVRSKSIQLQVYSTVPGPRSQATDRLTFPLNTTTAQAATKHAGRTERQDPSGCRLPAAATGQTPGLLNTVQNSHNTVTAPTHQPTPSRSGSELCPSLAARISCFTELRTGPQGHPHPVSILVGRNLIFPAHFQLKV